MAIIRLYVGCCLGGRDAIICRYVVGRRRFIVINEEIYTTSEYQKTTDNAAHNNTGQCPLEVMQCLYVCECVCVCACGGGGGARY